MAFAQLCVHTSLLAFISMHKLTALLAAVVVFADLDGILKSDLVPLSATPKKELVASKKAEDF